MTVPPGARSAVTRRLERIDVDHFATAESATEEYETIVYFSVERENPEPVVADLYEAGLDTDDHVVVLEIDIHGKTTGERGTKDGHERIAAVNPNADGSGSRRRSGPTAGNAPRPA